MNIDFDKTFIIAEIGGNHEGDFRYAKRLLKDAVESGVDAVKFQTYRPEKIVNKKQDLSRFNHFKKFCLKDSEFLDLAELCKERNVMFMSSIWDSESLEILDPFISIHKIGSGDLTNFPLIRKILETNKPLIISTAMADISEIRETVRFIKSIKRNIMEEKKLGILQCVAMYGDPKDEYSNLNVIKSLSREFPKAIIGYSDHSLGHYAANLAVAMGSKILEVHFTNDKTREFRDHQLSIDKNDMQELISNIRKTEKILGAEIKAPVNEVETEDRIKEFRRACYLKRNMKKGDVISEADLITLRPNLGIDARYYEMLLGKTLTKDIHSLTILDWKFFK